MLGQIIAYGIAALAVVTAQAARADFCSLDRVLLIDDVSGRALRVTVCERDDRETWRCSLGGDFSPAAIKAEIGRLRWKGAGIGLESGAFMAASLTPLVFAFSGLAFPEAVINISLAGAGISFAAGAASGYFLFEPHQEARVLRALLKSQPGVCTAPPSEVNGSVDAYRAIGAAAAALREAAPNAVVETLDPKAHVDGPAAETLLTMRAAREAQSVH